MPGLCVSRAMNSKSESPILTGRDVQCGEVSYQLCGISHTDPRALARLREQLVSGQFDAVAVELCPSRHAALVEPGVWGETDLFRIMREGKAGMLAATLALAGWQQRLAEQSGLEPGEELRLAVESALAQGLPVLLIDRDLGISLKRLSQRLPRGQRLQLFGGLLEGILSNDPIEEGTLQYLREGDLLETALAPYVSHSETLRAVLIDERDRYMAARLSQDTAAEGYRRVLVLAGQGHLAGIAAQLQSSQTCDQAHEITAELEASLPRSRRWRYLPWLIVAIILAGFAFGFSRGGADLGGMMVLDWILINGTLSGLGALIAGAHPLTILAAFLAAPWTSLNPMIGASMVAGAVEVYLRKPRVSDFDSLRQDLSHLRGWWRNRVSRTLMVFFLAGMGSSIGTYVAGFRIYDRLMGA